MSRLTISTENAEFQIIEALKLNRLKRNRLGELFIEGTECIKQAVNANLEMTRIIAVDMKNLSDWAKDLIGKNKNAKIIEMSPELYNSLCDRADPSELLATAKIRQNTLKDISEKNPFIIVFDRPSDYGNLGSVIRSANAFGADGICIVGHGIDIYESKVIRASLGSVFFTKVIHVESMDILKEFIEKQKAANNMMVIGTDSAGEHSIREQKIAKPVMVIIGNEAKGISIKLKELCDIVVRIPMEGDVNSLNVSCAASIVMWEVYVTKL